jgi:hypothetical protein
MRGRAAITPTYVPMANQGTEPDAWNRSPFYLFNFVSRSILIVAQFVSRARTGETEILASPEKRLRSEGQRRISVQLDTSRRAFQFQ